MRVILVRCANGIVVWVQRPTGPRTQSWLCTRDNFEIPQPSETSGVLQFLTSVQQHSVALMGALQQIAELTI